MEESYSTVEDAATAEFTEKRSRFIGEIRPVSAESDVAAFLSEKRRIHWDASHNCYAYLLRAGGLQRYSDDGEPQGTAGVPILEVLRREGLVDVAVVVTRYFGGTLLGAGGLVRAYTHATKIAVDAAVRARIDRCVSFSVTTPYPLYDRVNLLLQDMHAQVLDCDFAGEVTVRALLPARALQEFCSALTELSSGSLAPFAQEECFAPLRMP